MKKNIFLLFVLIVCTKSTCKNGEPTIVKSNLETIVLFRNKGYVKTYERRLEHYEKKDSTIVLNYQFLFDRDTTYFYYELPFNGKKEHTYLEGQYSDVSIHLMDSVVIRLNNEKRTIYKFKYDKIQSVDEEGLLYFTEDIGLLRIENYVWMNHSALVEHPSIDKALLYGYQECIRRRLKPFESGKRLPLSAKLK